MRKLLRITLIFCLALFMSVAQATTPKNWTFIIFINGDNSLDSYGAQNIKSMEQVGSNDQVNIVVQWASYSARKSRRLLVQKSTDPSKVTSPILQDLGYVDMGDYRNLQDFVEWAVKNYPAEHYFIDVWNHGGGWHLTNQPIWKDISYDDISGHRITTEQLGKAMKYSAELIGHKVDIYGSDACLMAMGEVADEMSASVDYFVGSQEVEPGAGWPYGDLLAQWEAIPNATPEQVSKVLVDAYVKSYQGGSSGTSEVTFSAFDLNKIADLNKAITKLGENIRNLPDYNRAKVLSVAKTIQNFMDEDYGDLLDFTKKLSAANIPGLEPENIAEVQATAKQFIIANADTKRYADATGLSIWIPTDRRTYDSKAIRYFFLQFNQHTQWGSTLSALLRK